MRLALSNLFMSNGSVTPNDGAVTPRTSPLAMGRGMIMPESSDGVL